MLNLPPEYAAFSEAAQRYCDCIETSPKTGTDFLTDVQDALLTLYLLATRLPDVSLRQADGVTKVAEPQNEDQDHTHWTEVYHRLGSRGFETGYSMIFNPLTDEPKDVVYGDLADDLRDIWRDMKEGLLALYGGKESSAVCWDWKFSFETHWGRHAIEALGVIRAHLQDR